MPILGLAHYNLRAPRDLLDTLRDFYCDVVGLSVGARPPFRRFGYWLCAGGHDILHLAQADAGDVHRVDVRTTFDHVAFHCRGRAEFEERLARHGIRYTTALVPGTATVQLFLKDPAGNGVELNFAAD